MYGFAINLIIAANFEALAWAAHDGGVSDEDLIVQTYFGGHVVAIA